MPPDALRNQMTVSPRTHKFIVYGYYVVAWFFSAFVLFYWGGLALATLAGTTFTSVNVATILASQIFCVALIAYHFEKGHRERCKLSKIAVDRSEPPTAESSMTRRASNIIANLYFTLATVSSIAVLLHLFGLFASLTPNNSLASANVTPIVLCNVVSVALIIYQFLRGCRVRSRIGL